MSFYFFPWGDSGLVPQMVVIFAEKREALSGGEVVSYMLGIFQYILSF
jgi:hypothetical protein